MPELTYVLEHPHEGKEPEDDREDLHNVGNCHEGDCSDFAARQRLCLLRVSVEDVHLVHGKVLVDLHKHPHEEVNHENGEVSQVNDVPNAREVV